MPGANLLPADVDAAVLEMAGRDKQAKAIRAAELIEKLEKVLGE